jgi:hypothetical protein
MQQAGQKNSADGAIMLQRRVTGAAKEAFQIFILYLLHFFNLISMP